MKINERKKIVIDRTDAHFDRACEAAYKHACLAAGVNDSGHMENVEGSDRSRDALHVEFVGYECQGGMGGISHTYKFEMYVTLEDDDG